MADCMSQPEWDHFFDRLIATARERRPCTTAGRPTAASTPIGPGSTSEVRAHMADHPGTSYADALDELALPPVDLSELANEHDVDRERLKLHHTVMASRPTTSSRTLTRSNAC